MSVVRRESVMRPTTVASLLLTVVSLLPLSGTRKLLVEVADESRPHYRLRLAHNAAEDSTEGQHLRREMTLGCVCVVDHRFLRRTKMILGHRHLLFLIKKVPSLISVTEKMNTFL